MKKLLLAVVVGLMVMATASIAAAEVTVGGSVDVRYDAWKNISLNNQVANFETINFFDERVMLNVDAKITEGLEAFIELDTEQTPWGLATDIGNLPEYLNHEMGNDVTSSGAFGQDGTGLRFGNLELRQAWINFMVPGAPVGIKIGHQPLALGHGIWLDTHRRGSDAILLYSKPMPELLVAAAYVQGSQSLPTTPLFPGAFNRLGGSSVLMSAAGLSRVADTTGFFAFRNDAKFYAALANYTWMENNTVGLNFTYVKDKATLSTIGSGDFPIWATNVGLVADGSIAGVTYKGEVDWLYVNVKGLSGALFGVGNDYTISAWAAMVGASYNVMNMANVGVEVAYGSGNDDNRPSIFYDPGGETAFSGAAVTHAMDHAYYTPYNSTSYNYAFLYNDKIGQGPLGSGGGFGFGDGFGGFGLANTGYVKVSVGATPMERLTAGLDVLYLRASGTMIQGQSKDLGWEVDANVGYKIYDNLKLDINGGVFIAGPWYAFQGHSAIANTALLTDPADSLSPIKRNNAYGLETKLTVNF